MTKPASRRPAAALRSLPRADFNGPDPEGFGTRQATIRKGLRVSMASAFLRSGAERPT